MTHYAGIEQDSVPARYYGQLSSVLEKNGIDPREILRLAHISPTQLADPEGRLTVDELERLVAACASIGKANEVALQLGRGIRLRNHNVVGFAILSSPSIDYAMRLVMRFFRLVFPAFRMRYELKQTYAEITYTPNMQMSHNCLAFHIEIIAAATYTAFEELLQISLPEFDMDISMTAPAHLPLYRQYMPQARLQFGALPFPGLQLHIPAAVVSLEPAMANQETLEVAEQRCRLMVEQIVNSRNIGAWARMILRESSDGLPSIEELSGTLNISPRTLHRYLKREGLVYRQLCVEERERRAKEMLSKTTLSITRIAQELGYNDASNFTRAFRTTAKCSPTQYRLNRTQK